MKGMSVTVRFDGDVVSLRDSKYAADPAVQPFITIPRGDWRFFLEAVVLGTEPDPWRGLPVITHDPDTLITITSPAGTQLTYFPEEWRAFRLAVGADQYRDGEAS